MANVNIPGLDKLLNMNMDTDLGDEGDSDGGDAGLEDELEAILAGRSIARPSRSSRGSSRPSTRQPGPSSSRRPGAKGPRSAPTPRGRQNQYDLNLQDVDKFSFDESNISDLDEADLNDDNLMAELANIAGEPSRPSRAEPEERPAPIPAVGHSRRAPPPPQPPAREVTPEQDLLADAVTVEPVRPPVPPRKLSSTWPPNAYLPTAQISSPVAVQPLKLVNDLLDLDFSNSNLPDEDKSRLVALRDSYRKAALTAKRAGDQANALGFFKIAKQTDAMINAMNTNQAVDLSNLPPYPSYTPPAPGQTSHPEVPQPQPSASAGSGTTQEAEAIALAEMPMDAEQSKKLFDAPPPPNSILEALEQRLEKFKSTADQAKEENNTSKVRRIGRIIKQYEVAVKACKAGKEYDYESLPPPPPGFGPLPTEGQSQAQPEVPKPVPSKPQAPNPVKQPAPPPPTQPARQPSPRVAQRPVPAPRPGLKRASSIGDKQLTYLLERQQLFKEAAIKSKQKGDIQQAKEYLRASKGFDPLIEATRSGLPINATSIPKPPQMEEDFVIVSHPEPSVESDDMEREEMFRKVEVELNKQIEMCEKNAENFLKLGDVSSSSKFEKYTSDSRKDLDMLRIHWRNGEKVPPFRYETRSFSIVICNPDLGNNEAEVQVVKAIDIPGKNDVDTYIRVEFPFPTVSSKLIDIIKETCFRRNPQETPQVRKTKTIKDSINPAYKDVFKFEMDRKARSLTRVFKRHPLKLEVYSKGGFLRSDALIGTCSVKLTDFEAKCTLHDFFPLMDGRKAVGGKVEVVAKIKEPLLAKQVEEVKEKWLVFT